MIILSAMVFSSVTDPSSHPEEKRLACQRNENYILALLKFDRVFFAISKYKLLFGEETGFWAKLTESRKSVESETDFSGSE